MSTLIYENRGGLYRMNMKNLRKIFVILCAFIMLLSVNYSVNAIDSTTPGTTVTTTTSTPGSTPIIFVWLE